MNNAWANLKDQMEKNPVNSIAVISLFLVAATKLLNARTASKNQAVWQQEVSRRMQKDYFSK